MSGSECPVSGPTVSILMVARNAQAHIEPALHSARRQTFRHIEILVVDDGSSDATASIVRRHADRDARVRLVAGPRKGLAAVRNASLAHARGRYGAILDSDDILHPRHIETLFSLATRYRADIAASNMLCFDDTGRGRAHAFIDAERWSGEHLVSSAGFVEAGRIDGEAPSLGYLKPLFDLRFLRRCGIEYDTGLRIGEDYDMVDRALRAGATYVVGPAETYFYRQHAGSTSHRLKRTDLEALLASERAKDTGPCDPGVAQASRARRASLERALDHLGAVEALKHGWWKEAARAVRRRPVLARMLLASAAEGLWRRLCEAADRGTMTRPSRDRLRALVIGRPRSGSPLDAALRRLRRDGVRLVRAGSSDRPAARARLAGRGPFDAILLADEVGWEIAPYALSPLAPVIGEATLDPARLDIALAPTGEARMGASLLEAIARFDRSGGATGTR